jgi:hypothetical protein
LPCPRPEVGDKARGIMMPERIMKKDSGGYDISLWERLEEDRYEERERLRKSILESISKLTDFFKDKDVKGIYLFGSLVKTIIVFNYRKIISDLEQFEEFLEKELIQ